jgi:hypothetical protein
MSVASVALPGCSREDIRIYHVAKAESGPADPGLPAGWQQLPPDQMRVGNYMIAGAGGAKAQVTVIPLPLGSGGELANVNRWRGQVNLGAITEENLASEAHETRIAGAPGKYYEFAGASPETGTTSRLMAAIQTHGDSVFYFKILGDDSLVKAQKDAFLGFLASYRYPDGGGAPPVVAAPVAPPLNPQAAPPSRTWPSPKGWERQQPGQMQDAKFLVGGGKAVLTVSIFDSPTGGNLANVNRWRQNQLGLEPVDEAGLAGLLTPLDLPGAKATLVDMKGPQQRMVAAIVTRGGSTWFFKLMGEDAAVGGEKKAFTEFVKACK